MKEDIYRGLNSSYDKAISLLDSIDRELLDQKVQDKQDGWTVIEVFRHLANAERGLTTQMINIVNGKESIPDDFDLNRYNDSLNKKLKHLGVDEIKAMWKKNRDELIKLLDSLEEDDFKKSGQHPAGKVLTIYEYFEIIVGHILQHVEQVELSILNK